MLLETIPMNHTQTVTRIQGILARSRRWLPLALVVLLAALVLVWLANSAPDRVEPTQGAPSAETLPATAAAAFPMTQAVPTTIHLPVVIVDTYTPVARPPEECLTYDGPGGYEGTVFAREHCVLDTGVTYRIETADHRRLYFAAEIKNGAGMTVYINNYSSPQDRVILEGFAENHLGQCFGRGPKFSPPGEPIVWHFVPDLDFLKPVGIFCLALENYTKPENSPMVYNLKIVDGPPQ